MQRLEGVAGVEADLEGIVAKRLVDARSRWHKVLNRRYSQRRGRAEWFSRVSVMLPWATKRARIAQGFDLSQHASGLLDKCPRAEH
jgi:hypothetical protein